MAERAAKRFPFGMLLQLLISGVLLWLLARTVPLEESRAALSRIRFGTVAAALALSLVGYVGRSSRWQRLLQRAGVRLGAIAAYRLTLLGILYGMLTPGRVGEFARILHLPVARSRTLASAIWDRVLDVVLLEIMSLPAFVLVPEWRGPLLWIYLAMVVVTVAGVVLLDRPGALAAVGRAIPPLATRLESLAEASGGTLRSDAFLAGLGGSLFFYLTSYGSAWLLLRDLAPHAPVAILLGFPIIPLLGNLPIAFGGLGLREQVSATVFARLGAGAGVGPVFSLLWFATATLIPGLIGLLLAPSRWAPIRVADDQGAGSPRSGRRIT